MTSVPIVNRLPDMRVTAASSTAVRGLRRHPLVTRSVGIGVAATVLGYLGAGVPSYWGDEAASVMSAERPWTSLAAELGRIDAVHGAYYAFLHVWINVFGATEWSTRAPSAIAVGFLAAGTVVLAARWFDPRVAVLAGVVCAVLPRTTSMATEARSYALGSALAVWITVAFVELVRRRSTSLWWWSAYGVAVAASATLFLYLLLLVPVHAVALAAARAPRSTWQRWAVATGIAAVGSAPILVAAYAERRQLRFLADRDYATPDRVLVGQWFGSAPVAIAGWLLVIAGIVAVVVGLRRSFREGGATTTLAGLAPTLAWLILPTAALLLLDATVSPTYSPRYLSFCVPAVAMLVALGIRATSSSGVRLLRRGPFGSGAADGIVPVVVGVAAAVLVAPVYLAQRTEWAKDGGSDLRGVAEYLGTHARPGEAIVFDADTKPSRRPRLAMHLYPSDFAGLQDVALRTPYVQRAGIWDRTVPVSDVAPTLDEPTVWAVELVGHGEPADVAALEASGYEVADSQLIHRSVVYRLEKE
ncbi:glycosyltransferase family 39 protein [Streptomyces sp. ISL-90]|nr:glycosyltransferase family 39 protein [Streptomyces sp. ISL-90]